MRHSNLAVMSVVTESAVQFAKILVSSWCRSVRPFSARKGPSEIRMDFMLCAASVLLNVPEPAFFSFIILRVCMDLEE